mgnify:CR=1 FL=1
MFRILKSNFLKLFLFIIAVLLFQSNFLSAQTENVDDPRSWKYFRIFARAQDDSIFIQLQDQLNIDPKLESYVLVVNILDPSAINQYVVIGDETSPDASRFLWSDLNKPTQQKLLNWAASNKENLNKKKITYASVFTDVIKKIKVKEVFAPPSRERDILSTTAYINPYFQVLGGDPLGIPIKKSVGLTFGNGTTYSGPLETDIVGAGFNILGFHVGVTSRITELGLGSVNEADTGEFYTLPTQNLADYNNLFAPTLGLNFSYVIPFGNFFEIGFFSVLDTGKGTQPSKVLNTATNELMPNNILNGIYTNFEFRYPFRFFGATRAKLYFAQLFGEKHLGYVGREMRLAGSVFDLRIDATFAGKRNFQLLIEPLISNIGEGFALSSFAIGPSFRFSTKDNNSFGLITIMVNMRLKIGDFFEERYGSK